MALFRCGACHLALASIFRLILSRLFPKFSPLLIMIVNLVATVTAAVCRLFAIVGQREPRATRFFESLYERNFRPFNFEILTCSKFISNIARCEFH